MDREEFRAGILEAFEAVKDPNDEIHTISKEPRDLADELRPHDPVLAAKLDNIALAIEDFVGYIKSKAEVTKDRV